MAPLSHILPPLSAATLLSASVCLPLPVGLFHSVLHSRARGLFRSARVCEKVYKFCPLAEKRGSLEGALDVAYLALFEVDSF